MNGKSDLTIELVAHMDAGDRRVWQQDQDTRPLSDLGRRQAEIVCNALSAERVDAFYSSTALRCRQTIEPLVRRFGLPITILTGLHETDAWQPPPLWRNEWHGGRDPLGGAYAAGLAVQSLATIRAQHGSGRVVACTHGDVVPSLIVYLIGAYGLELPAPNTTRGGWYTLRFQDGLVEVEHHDVLPNFPL